MKAKIYTQPDSTSNRPLDKCLMAISCLLVTTCMMLFQPKAFSKIPKTEGDTIVTTDSVKMNEGLMPALAKRTSRFAFENPNPTRYFFAPSAIPLNKGEGYVHISGISPWEANDYFPSVNVKGELAVTDHFSFGGGASLLPFVFHLNVKLGTQINDFVYAGVEAFYAISFFDLFEREKAIIGSLTFGNSDNNISLKGGLMNIYEFSGLSGFWGDGYDDSKSSVPILNVSGMVRLSKRFSIVSENWICQNNSYSYIDILNDNRGILMNGIRVMGKTHSIDVAAVLPISRWGGQKVLPYIDYVCKF